MKINSTKQPQKSQKKINIQAYKISGELYRQWNEASIIGNFNNYLVVSLKGARVKKENEKPWTVRENSVWIFRPKTFYNAILTLRGHSIHYYINLASDFVYEDNTIKFIDYDLDLKLMLPRKKIEIVDIDEFLNNLNKKLYTPDMQLEKIMSKQIQILFYNLLNQKDIFDKKFWTFFKTNLKPKPTVKVND